MPILDNCLLLFLIPCKVKLKTSRWLVTPWVLVTDLQTCVCDNSKKPSHIKYSVLISQNHEEKLLEVGPTSKNFWLLTEFKIKGLSDTSSIAHIMPTFSSYRNQTFGLQGKYTACIIRILTLNGF